MVDNRNPDQTSASTPPYITVYRLRPFSNSFDDKTYYLIDMPEYGDTVSLHSELHHVHFITACMQTLLEVIPKVNAIVLTVDWGLREANESVTSLVSSILEHFAKDMQPCLRTILTSSMVEKPPAIEILKSLGWPMEQDTVVEVNNSVLSAKPNNQNDPKIEAWWKLFMDGELQVVRLIRKAEAVATAQSAQVICEKIGFAESCATVRKQTFLTAVGTANCLEGLQTIAAVKTRNVSPEESKSLICAKNTLNGTHDTVVGGFNESEVLYQNVEKIKAELDGRNQLTNGERRVEDDNEVPRTFYNKLFETLHKKLQNKAPQKWEEPMKALVLLLKVILENGSVLVAEQAKDATA